MACDKECELIQFRVISAQFMRVQPRPPRGRAPADLEQKLLMLVKHDLEKDIHDCPEGCDCVVGEPVEVAATERIKKVFDGTYTAWYKVRLVKYRTPGECMPRSDTLPDEGA